MRRSFLPRRSSGAAVSLLGLTLLILLVPSVGATAPSAAPPTGSPGGGLRGGAPASLGPVELGVLSAAVPGPQVTAIFDWDPQPLILPPTFPSDQVAGEGAVMATSDTLGQVVLFGGESPTGLTNLTITASQATGGWNIGQPTNAPPPRANASFATFDGGRYAVLFGGLVNLTSGSADNQTWVYDYANRSWTNVTHPVAPPPRESAAFDAQTVGEVAVLEGGWDPSASVGGAGASVTWNDTWLLNLTTFNWTRSNASGAPRPMFGSSMVYDPGSDVFRLFGGCSTFCSNALYSFRPGENWTRTFQQGDVPPGRGGASAAFSAAWNVTIVSSGFVYGQNSYSPLNDSYVYSAASHTWDLIASSGGPSPRFAAAATYLNANQCPGFFVVGGSSALAQPPADGWFMDSNPDYGNGCNNWGGDQVGGGGGPPPNCTAITSLHVRLRDRATLLPIENATVQLQGGCGTVVGTTSSSGFANFSALPNQTVRLLALASDYHLNQTFVNLSLANGTLFTMFLDHLPTLLIRTVGVTYPNQTNPLGNVTIVTQGSIPLGVSDAAGWLNESGYPGPQGPTAFTGLFPGYSNGTTVVNVPYTGVLNVTLTLYADAQLWLNIAEYPDGTGIAGAAGVITPVGGFTFGAAVPYATDVTGWYNTTLPQANYSITASAPGFLPNATRTPVFLPWASRVVVTINLTLLRGANLAVLLVDADSLQPLDHGSVRVGYFVPRNVTVHGWANFTNIQPPGWYSVVGTAAGYLGNSTDTDLTYRVVNQLVILHLRPLAPCVANCPHPVNATTGTYRLLPSAGVSLDLFLLAPVLLALAGATYALLLRRRTESRA